MGFVDEIRALTLFKVKTKGKKIEDVSIDEIPGAWSKFRDSDDKWINLNYPKESGFSACLYEGQKGSEFDGHIHKRHDEIMMVLNEDGLVKVYTPKWNKILRYGESVLVPKGMAHYVDFIETTLFSVKWHPPMKGWKGKFINDENS